MAAVPQIGTSQHIEQFLSQELNKELLRFTTAGSVDDGKSTLIGRLLHDCKAVYEDQLASVKKSPVNRSGRAIDFSLLTDGLRAEREQGITIDVAYRYFSTPRRKFIIADTPGHEQYTRNMATGASTADLAVILVDATKGLLPQTKRHTYIAALLGIRHLLVAVNKMDLVEFREDVFERLQSDFSALARHLQIPHVQCVPISALDGDNLVLRSPHTPWYTGPTMLEHLETVDVRPAETFDSLRFPVQSVIRPDATFRGFAGRIASGTLQPGDEVVSLPAGQRTRVQSIVSFDGDLPNATAGDSVVLKLADEIDLGRGDMLVAPTSKPNISNRFSAMVVWLQASQMELNRTYLAKHAGRTVKTKAIEILHRVDINTLVHLSATQLAMNEIALVAFETSQPLYFDPYDKNRTTGSLVLIDPLTNATIGAVMIRGELALSSVSPPGGAVSSSERISRNGHRPAIFSLMAEREQVEALERALWDRGLNTVSMEASEASSELLQRLFDLGHAIITWNSSNTHSPATTAAFTQIAGDAHFDLSSAAEKTSSKGLIDEAIRLAETLHLDHRAQSEKAN